MRCNNDWLGQVGLHLIKKYTNIKVESLGESHGSEWKLSHVSSFRVDKHRDTLEAAQG